MVDRSNETFTRRLKAEVDGDVIADAFGRGRYATDASHYQMMPQAVVVPRTTEAAVRALSIARDESIAVTARGAGTSQCGQTINTGLVIDGSKHLRRLVDVDPAERRCVVEPGIVLDDLNRALAPHGLWFPVDVSTASRATIGGMVGNNSCGGRSLRYGTTRDNVVSIDAVLADGTPMHFGEVDAIDCRGRNDLTGRLVDIGAREADEVAARFPKVQRRVGGYNLDALDPSRGRINLAHLLVGSEGTLAYSTAIELRLSPLLGPRGVGVCHFGSFNTAMRAAQHLVTLKPIAIELVDATMLQLAGEIPIFRPILAAVVRGEPEALLLVEFAETPAENGRRLRQLGELMGDLGFGFDRAGPHWGGVVEVLDPGLQQAITELRTSGLNIMMSMKDQSKPVSFVEDCAVPLEHLAEYTESLTQIFDKHGTRGTWYAHASEGCLHVRPVLNLRLEKDVRAMRAIAEEAFAMVRAYKGSHSGEHGDGIVRSEFHAAMFGSRLVRAFEDVKDAFDPAAVLNPGKIVRAPRFDDRSLMRYPPDYGSVAFKPQLDWTQYPGNAGGFQGAVEMCNNNGACRKIAGGAMCPSYRATRDEQHVTRGRANTLRLALSGRLGPDALASDAMAESLSLCVSCKACRRECPTGVDMARMKIEVLAARAATRGYSLRDKLVARLPHYAKAAARIAPLLNRAATFHPARRLLERWVGLSARRTLPLWRRDRFRGWRIDPDRPTVGEVVLWADTFNMAFEPENLAAGCEVLTAAGYRVYLPRPSETHCRPLCCGRTFLSVGNVEAARREMRRSLDALQPFLDRGMPVVGLEPSCLLTFCDELPSIIPGKLAQKLADNALLLEDYIVREVEQNRFNLKLRRVDGKALVHGHCHQKAFGRVASLEAALRLIPGLEVELVDASCCGMAGAFGYQAESIDTSMAMGELALFPAIRSAPRDAVLVADGVSCRHQIKEGTGKTAAHAAQVIANAIEAHKAA